MEYVVSIRIDLPEDITALLQKEKERFVTEYGSGYKSDPHVTLYLDSYTQEGFPRLIQDLKKLSLSPFAIALLGPEARLEKSRNRYLYVVDVSNKEKITELHDKVSRAAIPYQSPFLREKTRKRLEERGIYTEGKREKLKSYNIPDEPFNPHITLGEVGLDNLQPDLAIVRENLKKLEGRQMDVLSFVVYFHGKEDGDEKFKLIEKVVIPFTA